MLRGNGFGHGVQCVALFTADDLAAGMVLPRCQQQQTTLRTSIESLSDGLVQLGEAVLHEVYQRVTMLVGRVGDLLLCLGDEGSDEDGPALRSLLALAGEGLSLIVRPATPAVDGHQGPLQQGEVADGVEVVAGNVDAAVDGEIRAVSAFQQQAAWVVSHVGYHVLQLLPPGEDAVVVTLGEEPQVARR